MSEQAIYTLGAAALARGIRGGRFTPSEVIEAHIARIQAVVRRVKRTG